LVLEEKIEYNDLVNSIQDGHILGDDEHDVLTSGNKRAEPENGNFSFVLFIYACFSFVNNLIFCVTASFFSVY
jgi:hypothetical protein